MSWELANAADWVLPPRQLVVQHLPAYQYCCRNTKTNKQITNKQQNKTEAQNSKNITYFFGQMTLQQHS